MRDNAHRVGREIAAGCLRILRWFLPLTIQDGYCAPLDVGEFRRYRFRYLNRVLMGVVLLFGLHYAARDAGYFWMSVALMVPLGVLGLILGMLITFWLLYARRA